MSIHIFCLATAIRQQREIKGIQIGNEEVKLSLLKDDILDMENAKDSTPKLSELIPQFNNVAGYKIIEPKSVTISDIINENTEMEFRESIPFTTAPKP